MPVSPETEIGAAYLAGQVAANASALAADNPFLADGSALGVAQARAWAAGFNDQVKGNVNQALYQQADPPVGRKAVVTLTQAQVATLFSSPVSIIPGTPSKITLVDWLHIRKPAGTAWTTTGSGILRLQYDASPFSLQFGIFDQAATTAFFGAAAAVWLGAQGKGSAYALGDSTPTNNMSGAGVRLGLATADISGGTGGLIVTAYYRLWPGL